LHYVYILRCADDSLYTGYTTDLEARETAHHAGRGAKYTRSRRPVAVVYSERFRLPARARAREYALKQLTRAEKLALLAP
jgi:putative endonuclease